MNSAPCCGQNWKLQAEVWNQILTHKSGVVFTKHPTTKRFSWLAELGETILKAGELINKDPMYENIKAIQWHQRWWFIYMRMNHVSLLWEFKNINIKWNVWSKFRNILEPWWRKDGTAV